MSQTTLTVGLVGVGGYGGNYARQLLTPTAERNAQLVGVVDPFAQSTPAWPYLQERQIPSYGDVGELYAEQQPDLLIIASPTHHHMPQTRFALSKGSHVLCEKPLAATVQDGLETLAVEKQSGRFVAIGYNWSFTPPILQLKEDIRSGLLGAPIRLSSLTLWPRWQVYYTRNRWAGHIHSADGDWVLDSPLNNATAHHLHNMLFLLGDEMDQSAFPVQVEAERYRANPIENYDTVAMRAHLADGVEIFFFTAHPVKDELGPIFRFEFEDATVTYSGRESEIVAQFHDGRVRSYGNPETDAHSIKLDHCLNAIRRGTSPVCGIEAALAQTLCMNGVQESGEIVDFPPQLLYVEEDQGIIEGLPSLFFDCYQRGLLPSERGDVPWASAGEIIDLSDYTHFPS
ncbi:gfo/Idh/MocA family oxidoreductase [bacterium]|nr:gfo/Idh/MocA family oxidoreductase [bacterium]